MHDFERDKMPIMEVIMDSMNESYKEYFVQLRKGDIQRAYRGIMSFMSALKLNLEGKHPGLSSSALYAGYMDMTYFALTPAYVKEKGLKVAIVFLHEKACFEIWLAGANRRIQSEQISSFSKKKLGGYTLSSPLPGVDSIISWRLGIIPEFDRPETLMKEIDACFVKFIDDVSNLLA